MSERISRRSFLRAAGTAAAGAAGILLGFGISEVVRGGYEGTEEQQLQRSQEAKEIKKLLNSAFNPHFIEKINFMVQGEDGKEVSIKLTDALEAGVPPPISLIDLSTKNIRVFVEGVEELNRVYNLVEEERIEANLVFSLPSGTRECFVTFQPNPLTRGVDLDELFKIRNTVLKRQKVDVEWEMKDTQYIGIGELQRGKFYKAFIDSLGSFRVSC